jgi:hypothetical protein
MARLRDHWRHSDHPKQRARWLFGPGDVVWNGRREACRSRDDVRPAREEATLSSHRIKERGPEPAQLGLRHFLPKNSMTSNAEATPAAITAKVRISTRDKPRSYRAIYASMTAVNAAVAAHISKVNNPSIAFSIAWHRVQKPASGRGNNLKRVSCSERRG